MQIKINQDKFCFTHCGVPNCECERKHSKKILDFSLRQKLKELRAQNKISPEVFNELIRLL